jgi:hypothetical protein
MRILQAAVIAISVILLFLLLYTLRDILLRTRSFLYQFVCILLVGALPILGFLLYLLIRPARTLKERETEEMVRRLLGAEDEEDMTTMEQLNEQLIMIEKRPESDSDEAISETTPPAL